MPVINAVIVVIVIAIIDVVITIVELDGILQQLRLS